ncbi:PrsW family intramembrane metalloprotease [Sinomicrobium weinanense]|uniref:Protease PrsW n=1 Tax=Sinomicrobium weinanense TaxID=2842200 RepID=A0A926JRK5_9FLAO|nr:PrsW family glutamic-type intramembrane protease [Sinomicrobium weinanense]MBC9796200.1 PrsW family intramembrane metalloprotease [Sinomicrobium weinanense]MBU3123479.1 PrsW family intramembrane metalloprotease [Sinomicrobium weinanense]
MNIIISALAPVAAVIIYIYIKDKYEKEPLRLLFFSFVLGAVASIIITTIISMVYQTMLPLPDNYNIWQQFIKAFLVVGLTEEFSKYVIVRYFAQPNKAFNEPFDGIVYAVMVSMGFAATENIFYVLEGGYEVALLRAFTAVPAHATFGVLMGYFMGKAKFSRNKAVLNLCGLFLAAIFHGAYDFFLFINFIPGTWTGAVISLAIGLFLSRKVIKKHQTNSRFKL